MEFISTDGEWSNIYVDGELVLEFRNQGKQSIRLTPGIHHVEIKDFMDREVWASGTLSVGAVDPLKIGFAKKAAPQSYNDPAALKLD